MQTVLLVIHMMIAATLVGVVLVQRSEGGALGIGGGGFMSGRGAANALTRLTTYLAAAFFATSIALALWAKHGGHEGSLFDTTPATPAAATAPAPADGTTPPATPEAPAAPGETRRRSRSVADTWRRPRPDPAYTSGSITATGDCDR